MGSIFCRAYYILLLILAATEQGMHLRSSFCSDGEQQPSKSSLILPTPIRIKQESNLQLVTPLPCEVLFLLPIDRNKGELERSPAVLMERVAGLDLR
jgi:hypothetical protein